MVEPPFIRTVHTPIPVSSKISVMMIRAIAALLDQKCEMSDMAAVLPEMDIIVMACVQNSENMGMINASFLSHCKLIKWSRCLSPFKNRRGVLIVNVCRGGLLDEEAILQGLKEGTIGGLGLDVQWIEPFDPHHSITQHPKCTNEHFCIDSCLSSVLLTPHVAGVTRSSYEDMAGIVAKEIQRIKKGQAPARIVNGHLLQCTD